VARGGGGCTGRGKNTKAKTNFSKKNQIFSCKSAAELNSATTRDLQAKTVKGYVESVNRLFKLRGFPIPANLSDINNTCTRLIDVMETEEVIAKQQNPITNEMFANLEKPAQQSPRDSTTSVLIDLFCLIRITSFRVAEYAQTTQTKVDMHECPSGN
jgi:hypothetical protein